VNNNQIFKTIYFRFFTLTNNKHAINPDHEERIILATSRYIGDGFDKEITHLNLKRKT